MKPNGSKLLYIIPLQSLVNIFINHYMHELSSVSRLLLLVSRLAYSSTLKMEAICYPEMSGFQRATRR
jgi:hypothetical protein